MDVQTRCAITERQARIVEIVSQQGFATTEALSRDFGVSPQSVRRDIIRPDDAELLLRFHGGVSARKTSVHMGDAEKRIA
jgi:DeoR family transcriptional regulator, glycerol-3-phosphate regulon repressor